MDHSLIGHNLGDLTIEVEVRLFNSLSRFGGRDGHRRNLSLPAGSTLGDVLDRLGIPQSEVFLALQNGRDVTAGLHTGINTERTLDEGDVVALSGPVPYSWGYGSPVV
jgi:sulfur carrier protein ThiS